MATQPQAPGTPSRETDPWMDPHPPLRLSTGHGPLGAQSSAVPTWLSPPPALTLWLLSGGGPRGAASNRKRKAGGKTLGGQAERGGGAVPHPPGWRRGHPWHGRGLRAGSVPGWTRDTVGSPRKTKPPTGDPSRISCPGQCQPTDGRGRRGRQEPLLPPTSRPARTPVRSRRGPFGGSQSRLTSAPCPRGPPAAWPALGPPLTCGTPPATCMGAGPAASVPRPRGKGRGGWALSATPAGKRGSSLGWCHPAALSTKATGC